MGKLIKSTLRLVLLLALLAWTLLYWRSLRGVDAFLQLYPTNSRIDYDWLVPWFDGKARLFGIRVYDQQNDLVVKAKQLVIDLQSLKSLITARELLELRDFPRRSLFILEDAVTTADFKAARMFNFLPKLELATALLPKSCQNLSFEPRPFVFNAQLEVIYDITGSSIDWNASIESAEFSRIKLHLRQANIDTLSGEAGFVDEMQLKISDPLWLSQLSQQCQKQLGLTTDKPTTAQAQAAYLAQLADYSNAHNWRIKPEFSEALAHWLVLPGELEIAFEPPKGISFQQLAEANVETFPELTGLKLRLENQIFDEFFSAQDYISELAEAAKQSAQSQKPEPQAHTPKTIQPSYRYLRNYLDAKVEVRLTNGGSMTGYIRKVDQAGFELEVRETSGSSLLPFGWEKVKSIRLIRVQR